jgi:hypothetical protein
MTRARSRPGMSTTLPLIGEGCGTGPSSNRRPRKKSQPLLLTILSADCFCRAFAYTQVHGRHFSRGYKGERGSLN